MKKYIYTIISAPMGFSWVYIFTLETFFSIIVGIIIGVLAYYAGMVEDEEKARRDGAR